MSLRALGVRALGVRVTVTPRADRRSDGPGASTGPGAGQQPDTGHSVREPGRFGPAMRGRQRMSPHTASEVPGVFDEFVADLDYPMFVVTAAHPDDGARSGCLVGFASQCSIDPPRFLVCVSVTNHTHAVALATDTVAVHALSAQQHALAALFGEVSGDDLDKFDHCAWTAGPHGVPLLTDCPQRFVGHIHERIDLGDHTGLVLAPLDSPATPGSDSKPGPGGLLTLTAVRDLEPGHEN